jgi:hypothetical protein
LARGLGVELTTVAGLFLLLTLLVLPLTWFLYRHREALVEAVLPVFVPPRAEEAAWRSGRAYRR